MNPSLVSRPVPSEDEALDGYLDRASELVELPLAVITGEDGIDASTHLGGYATVWLPEHIQQEIDVAFELPPGTAAGLTLAGRYPDLFPSLRDVTTHLAVVRGAVEDWFHLAGSRYCGPCLAEDGVWRLNWRIPAVLACTRHMVLLADSCPKCGAFPRSSGTSNVSHRTYWYQRVRQPTLCYAREPMDTPARGRASQPCLGDLTATPPQYAGESIERFQNLIAAALRGARANPMAGGLLTGRGVLRAARELLCIGMRLMTLSHVEERADTRIAKRRWRTPLRETTQGAQAASLLEPVWAAQSAEEAGTALARISTSLGVPVDKNFFRDCLGKPQALAQVYTEATTNTGRYSTRLRRRHTAVQDAPSAYSPSLVPQLAWPCTVPPALRNRTGKPSDAMIRAVLSLSLVRLVTGTWDSAAIELNLPERSGQQWSRYVLGQLSDTERDTLHTAVLQTADRLAGATGGCDYSTQRHVITRARDLATAQEGRCSTAREWCPCGHHVTSRAARSDEPEGGDGHCP